MQQSYTAKFTPTELTNLIALFQSAKGQQILKYVRLSNMAELISGNGGTLDYTAADKAEADKFAVTALGKKFMETAYGDSKEYLDEYLNAKIEEAKTRDGGNIKTLTQPANLNKIINQFVKDNYK